MNLVVKGLMNKQVAFELDISEITVKAHRGRVMEKMQATTFVDLVNMAGQAGNQHCPRSLEAWLRQTAVIGYRQPKGRDGETECRARSIVGHRP